MEQQDTVRYWMRETRVWVYKHARACIFAGSFFVLLFLSNEIPLAPIARYDFLFVAAVVLQVILVKTKIETKDEVATIALFHAIGLGLELFKTHPAIGSWAYPEDAFFKIWGVPLYSGFMYAAVASFMMQAWRLLNLKLEHYPNYRFSLPLSVAIYANFFTHHYLPDLRWILAALVVVVFWKTNVVHTVTETPRKIKLVLTFFLIGFFIWIAENISTFLGAWQYPDQADGWQLVHISKISSWALLVIISFIIVADLKHFKSRRRLPVDSQAEPVVYSATQTNELRQ